MELGVQWNLFNTTTFGPWKIGRVNEVGSHDDATRFKHVLHMNTFNSSLNQPFYVYFSALQQQFITTEQNRVHVMRKINNDVFQFLNRI